ncbi:unnamed protein product [Auanema sp. JU1783]|nr:unnamed protein product [Auanema sp. JU1783]
MFSSNQSNTSESPMNLSSFPTETSFHGRPEDQTKNGFLFGSKRRINSSAATQFLNTSNVSAPSTDIFASPAVHSSIPSHIKESANSSAKSVHWSPSLVQEQCSRVGVITASPVPPVKQSHSHISNYSSPAMNGPPLRSLKDDVEPVKKAARRSMNVSLHTPSQKLSTTLPNGSAISPDMASDTWVTVFGFPSDQTTNVLKYFSRHGEVVSHQIPKKGNWLHIKYSCPIHARQALSRNASVLDGTLRIGVVPCTEKDIIGSETVAAMNTSAVVEQVIREEMENESHVEERSGHPLFERDQNITSLETSLNVSRFGSISRSGMRSLASSYEVRGGSLRVSQPVKQESIMNKIWNAVGF